MPEAILRATSQPAFCQWADTKIYSSHYLNTNIQRGGQWWTWCLKIHNHPRTWKILTWGKTVSILSVKYLPNFFETRLIGKTLNITEGIAAFRLYFTWLYQALSQHCRVPTAVTQSLRPITISHDINPQFLDLLSRNFILEILTEIYRYSPFVFKI
jgi:hypothetical protein